VTRCAGIPTSFLFLLGCFGLGLPGLSVLVCPGPALGQDVSESASGDTARITFSGLFYLGFEGARRGGVDSAAFVIDRSYLTARVRILPRLTGRLTLDTSQDREGDGRGDMEVRLKYAYAKYDLGELEGIRDLSLEGGIVHMVWLAFEEHINLYRMRDPMFLERTGIFNSADFGLTLSGSLGPDLPAEYRNEVSSDYAGRWGSFALGLYNGGGYHGDERNTNKVVQGRLTLRPFPDRLPGFQVSGLGIVGKGNRSGDQYPIPDWRTFDLFLSYQHPRGTVTAQRVWGEGNQKGTWTEPFSTLPEAGEATDYSGASVFGELRPGGGWRILGGYDQVDRTPGLEDAGLSRIHLGVGYDLGRQNILLLDWDRLDWDREGRATDSRVQLVFQVKF